MRSTSFSSIAARARRRSPPPARSCSRKAGACSSRWTPSPTASSASPPAGEHSPASPPPTRLRLRTEGLAGTWEALVTGQADLAIGVSTTRELPSGTAMKELGTIAFVFAVAPHHPLAAASEPLADTELIHHRAVAVADSAH